MKREHIILGGVALAAGAIWLSKRGAAPVNSADAARMDGMRQVYSANAGQMAGVDAAIRGQWAAMDSVFRGQPDFYI